MVEDAALEIDAGRELAAFVQILVDRVAAGEQRAGDGDFVADLERADGGFGNGGG